MNLWVSHWSERNGYSGSILNIAHHWISPSRLEVIMKTVEPLQTRTSCLLCGGVHKSESIHIIMADLTIFYWSAHILKALEATTEAYS